jgi:hypothetical protein
VAAATLPATAAAEAARPQLWGAIFADVPTGGIAAATQRLIRAAEAR